jgi:hypothetical protein
MLNTWSSTKYAESIFHFTTRAIGKLVETRNKNDAIRCMYNQVYNISWSTAIWSSICSQMQAKQDAMTTKWKMKFFLYPKPSDPQCKTTGGSMGMVI